MKIFAILTPAATPAMDAKVVATFPNHHLKPASNQWLIATNTTATELSHQLDITRLEDGKIVRGSMDSAIVLSVSTYFGNGPTSWWEWLKTQVEAAS